MQHFRVHAHWAQVCSYSLKPSACYLLSRQVRPVGSGQLAQRVIIALPCSLHSAI